jgi:brefeldin A-resistance guanine nucleotide exchange factor 1
MLPPPPLSLPAASLWPFLDAVRSEEANSSLTSLHEVMTITEHSLPCSALREVIDALASYRFEAGAEANVMEAALAMWRHW